MLFFWLLLLVTNVLAEIGICKERDLFDYDWIHLTYTEGKEFWLDVVDRPRFYFWNVREIKTDPYATTLEIAEQYDRLMNLSFSRDPITRFEKKMRLLLVHGMYGQYGGGDRGWQDVVDTLGLDEIVCPINQHMYDLWMIYSWTELTELVDHFIWKGADFSALKDPRVKMSYLEWVRDCVSGEVPEELYARINALEITHKAHFSRYVEKDHEQACNAVNRMLEHPEPFTLRDIVMRRHYRGRDGDYPWPIKSCSVNTILDEWLGYTYNMSDELAEIWMRTAIAHQDDGDFALTDADIDTIVAFIASYGVVVTDVLAYFR